MGYDRHKLYLRTVVVEELVVAHRHWCPRRKGATDCPCADLGGHVLATFIVDLNNWRCTGTVDEGGGPTFADQDFWKAYCAKVAERVRDSLQTTLPISPYPRAAP